MCADGASPSELLGAARAGDLASLGPLLECYRSYLLSWAYEQLDPRLQVRCSASDVVQETFLEAFRDFAGFQGAARPEFLAWLRRIMINNLLRAAEKHRGAQLRSVNRELRPDCLDAVAAPSGAVLQATLANSGPSPRSKVSGLEQSEILFSTLAELSPDHRQVLVLRHLQGLPFKDVAQQMGRTSVAARGLWVRAMDELRRRLKHKGLQ